MDDIIHAISRGSSEAERRQILKLHAQICPRLLAPPKFPHGFKPYDGRRLRRDCVHFVAELSAFDQSGLLLLRCVYSGEFGYEPGEEERGFTMIGMVGHLELATSEWAGAPPFWTKVGFGLLPPNVVEALDERLIEHERMKS